MMKKHQKISIHVISQRTSLKQQLNKTFKPTKKTNVEEKRVIIDKVINVLQFLVESGGETYAAVRQWRRSGIFTVNFEHVSHLVLVFLLLTLNI